MSLHAEIYLKAAELVALEWERFACLAVDEASGCVDGEYTKAFERLFQPENAEPTNAWFGHDEVQENRDARVTALLLMAEIVEAEMAEQGEL